MERMYVSSPSAVIGDYWFPPDQIYVSVKSSEINTNNITATAPYTVTECNGDPYVCICLALTDQVCHPRTG